MSKSVLTTLALVALSLVLGGASYYTTDVVQARETERLRDSRRVAELMNARVEDLLAQEAVSAEAAGVALSRWHSRYKYIPREMNTADIVEYLEGLTRVGFEQFDLALAGQTGGADFSTYTFKVQGTGSYPALYRLIWHLENNREFYRVSTLQMEHVVVTPDAGALRGAERDLVKFTFDIHAYFGGADGISAPENALAPIPVGLLLPSSAPRDIFTPLVRVPRGAASTSVEVGPSEGGAPVAAAPPSTLPEATPARPAPEVPRGLDVERARLTFIVGNEAYFEDDRGRHAVRVGDAVVGGVIERIDGAQGIVVTKIGEGANERMVIRSLTDGRGGR